jgi:hypothetical protein
MQLHASNLFRLYAVSEKEDSGKHALEEFSANMSAFNEPTDSGDVDDALKDLATAQFGESGCQCFELMHGNVHTENGKIRIDDGDDRILVSDIYGKIDADPEVCRFFVITNSRRTDAVWIVAMPDSNVYSD